MALQSVVWLLCLSLSLVTTENDLLQNLLFSGTYEIVDLTYTFDNDTAYPPDNKKFVFTKKIFKGDTSPYSANEFGTAEHGGTHLDAPEHFLSGGLYVAQLPVENFVVPLVIIDASDKVNGDPNYVLYMKDVNPNLDVDDSRPFVVIFKFGWSQYYNDSKYLGIDEDGKLNFPGLSDEVLIWLTNKYPLLVGIGVDTASVDPGSSEDFPVHIVSANNSLYNLENVKLTRNLPASGCTVLVMPMKIGMGTGAPLRLMAICPTNSPGHRPNVIPPEPAVDQLPPSPDY